MADEEVEKKKKSPILLIIVLVIIGLIFAGGISYFVTTKVMTDSVGKAQKKDPGIFVKLGDAKDGIIVNVGGVKSGRFLKVGIVLEMNPGNEKNIKDGKIVPAVETKVLDTVLQILRSQKIEEFDPSKQDSLKSLIKDQLNQVIGDGAVYDVYITNFVLQ